MSERFTSKDCQNERVECAMPHCARIMAETPPFCLTLILATFGPEVVAPYDES